MAKILGYVKLVTVDCGKTSVWWASNRLPFNAAIALAQSGWPPCFDTLADQHKPCNAGRSVATRAQGKMGNAAATLSTKWRCILPAIALRGRRGRPFVCWLANYRICGQRSMAIRSKLQAVTR